MKLTQAAYAGLIAEDVRWLTTKAPESLERDHIVTVLHDSVGRIYSKDRAVMAQMEEALRKIVECEENRARDLRHRESWLLVKFSEERMQKAKDALSAYQSLGEQS